MAAQQQTLIGLVDDIRELKALLKEKDQRIADLERWQEDLEQYIRMDEVLIMGLETRHRSYARVVANGQSNCDCTTLEEELTLEQQVLDAKLLRLAPLILCCKVILITLD
ncbi:hypothetical protein LDENG_00126150 [Lucifuga dentata]|nr:hypothetical protein LDENG_00126150 [Lucifuga dentata]